MCQQALQSKWEQASQVTVGAVVQDVNGGWELFSRRGSGFQQHIEGNLLTLTVVVSDV